MYVGRVVAVGRNKAGQSAALYRISSRSFPNREARILEKSISIVPKKGHETDVYVNPYIAYNCLRIVDDVAVVSNGSQTDPIAEKLKAGMTIRDAISVILLTLDYEKDDYNTPRIAGAIRRGAEIGFLGVVRKDGLHVREIPVGPGEVFYVATYEHNDVSLTQRAEFDASTPDAGAAFVLNKAVFGQMTHPVTAACALEKGDGFERAVALA